MINKEHTWTETGGIRLRDDERIDDLQRNHYGIIQRKGAHGIKNPGDAKAIARHEVLCTLEDVVREGTCLLRPGGRFYMVHRPRRLIEIIQTMKKHGLEPKRMKFVHPYRDREANMVLIEAVRGGGALLKAEAPVIVFDENGEYSEEIRTTYGY